MTGNADDAVLDTDPALLEGASVRRSRHLIATWDRDQLVVSNFATGTQVAADAADQRMLATARAWIGAERLVSAVFGRDRERGMSRLKRLVDSALVHVSGAGIDPAEDALERWGPWNPAAGWFHTATRFDSTPTGMEEPADDLRVTLWRQPDVLKRYAGRPVVALPAPGREDPLARALLARRTWRQFGEGNVHLADLATLLGLTWGVQGWFGEERPQALKTSPSGGARHSIEAYVVASRVEGLEPGTYHYDPDGHRLTALCRPTTGDLTDLLPPDCGFEQAAVVVFMTSVFARVQWRYSIPRAYRNIFIEAGHLGQTFCLVATRLGLGPFTTAAFNDATVEEHLGIDGIDEGVIYAAGVGARPTGVDWAVSPCGVPAPRIRRPAWQAGEEAD